MTRQAQNMILGGLAFAVGIVAMIAVFLLMMDDQGQTTAGAPLAPIGEAEELTDRAGDGSLTATSGESTTTTAALKPLAVMESPTTVAEPLITTSTVVSTTVTTAAPTTKPPTTAESTTTTDTAPETTTTTADESESDTSMPDSTASTDSTEATTTTTQAGGEETTTSIQTETTQATTTTTVEAPPETQPPSPGGLNDVEREIARMTNELRTNPNGPLKREGAVIDCGGRIRVSDGQYEPIGAVEISEVASLQVARPWSAQMTRSNFQHQPNAGVPALQAAGISIRSAGENIAYHSYSDKAWVHFRGWRESDGHFCNMMDPGFTHLGVGEVSKDDGISYATQNFYSTR